MSAALDARGRRNAAWLEALPLAAGLLAMYVPVLYETATTLWRTDEHAHGPLIAVLAGWLGWRKRAALAEAPGAAPVAGHAILILGLVIYVLGRSQGISVLAVGSLVPVLAGALLAVRGWQALRAFSFPLLFTAFMVPLPGTFVDALTGPLKQMVSQIAEQLLYAGGFPIARSGVVLTIGQYQLLVADACSGLNSMFSLSALGLLYMYLMRRASLPHNLLLFASVLPIAFAANIIRTLSLVLITYYLGDEAGQGFLHGAAGIVLILAALVILLLLDRLLARVFKVNAA